MNQNRERARQDFQTYTQLGATFLLPLASMIETGNHVAHHGDGGMRRRTAERFRILVKRTLKGDTPWAPVNLFANDWLADWIDEFPDQAMRESGFGDLWIIKEFERQCRLQPLREVFIWSYDEHLHGYHQTGTA